MPRVLQFPRVLIVLMSKIKADDPVNLLIRMQFGGWPTDRLAQIHSGETAGRGEFCGHYYALRIEDRAYGWLFAWLRRGVAEMVAMSAAAPPDVRAGPVGVLARWSRVARKRLGDALVASGLWEVVFQVRLSRQMEAFVRDFDPHVIYCQGYSLGFATLPLLISRRFGLPICFQTTDDWPHRAYRRSPVRWLIRQRAGELVRHAKVRLAFGEKMQLEYQRRYGVPFEITHHLDDPGRFVAPAGCTPGRHTIVYTGNLAHRRYEAIQDLLKAVRSLPELGDRAEIVVYCAGIPKDMPRELLGTTGVRLAPLPAHNALPSVLASATILFLPESFNEPRQSIEFSISTKAHLYMMSGRPVLVYGPQHSGTVDYARREAWAFVVSERDPSRLREAVQAILSNRSLVERLREAAQECIRRHHDLVAGRQRFREVLSSLVDRAAEL